MSAIFGAQEYVHIQARECGELKEELKMPLPWAMNKTLQGQKKNLSLELAVAGQLEQSN